MVLIVNKCCTYL